MNEGDQVDEFKEHRKSMAKGIADGIKTAIEEAVAKEREKRQTAEDHVAMLRARLVHIRNLLPGRTGSLYDDLKIDEIRQVIAEELDPKKPAFDGCDSCIYHNRASAEFTCATCKEYCNRKVKTQESK